MRPGFVETCEICTHLDLCTDIGAMSFDTYIPGSPGYIPLMLCSDDYSEKTLPIEATSHRTKPGHSSPETMEERRQTILDYLEDTQGEMITSNDVQEQLDIGHRHTTHLLSLMIKDGQVVRHKAGSHYYYTLPGVKPDISDTHTTEHVRDSIIESLRQGPLTTPEIHALLETDATLSATRNHLYRLEAQAIVEKMRGRYVSSWALI